MIWFWLLVGALLVCLACFLFFGRRVRSWGRLVLQERARESFALQRERLEAQFLNAAAATGKPRGLRWLDCAFERELELAREIETGQIVGLVPVAIRFEAVEGGDMEGLPAVGNLRNASAVFVFERGRWWTAGKAVFNLNPAEVLQRFGQQYEPLASA
jgi:hypothetical protein